MRLRSVRLPNNTDLNALASYVLVTMEGGVMLSRSARSVEPFDHAVVQLRQHFELLLAQSKVPRKTKSSRKKSSLKRGQ